MEGWSPLVKSSDVSALQSSASAWKFVRSSNSGIDRSRLRSSECTCAPSPAVPPSDSWSHAKSSPNLSASKDKECRGPTLQSKRRGLGLRTRSAARVGEAQLPPLPPKIESLDENNPSIGNLSAERHSWMRKRVKKLLERFEPEDIPAVPLVPHWSGGISLPNKEAYFQANADGGLYLQASDDLSSPNQSLSEELGSTWPESTYICDKCKRIVRGERVHVQIRVDDGRVHVHLEVRYRGRLHSDSLPQLLHDHPSHVFGRTFGRGRKGPCLSRLMQCFSFCAQPQVRA